MAVGGFVKDLKDCETLHDVLAYALEFDRVSDSLNVRTAERKGTFDLNALHPEDWKTRKCGIGEDKSIKITKRDSWNAETVVKKT